MKSGIERFLAKCQNKGKHNFYKNSKNKINSKVEEISNSHCLTGNSSVSKSSESAFKSLSKNKKKVILRKSSHFFNLRSVSRFRNGTKKSSKDLRHLMSPSHFNSKKKLTDFLKVD